MKNVESLHQVGVKVCWLNDEGVMKTTNLKPGDRGEIFVVGPTGEAGKIVSIKELMKIPDTEIGAWLQIF